MKMHYLSLAAAIVLSGCASVVNDKTHPIRIETKTEAGELIVGADCTLKSDKAQQIPMNGQTASFL